MRTKMNKKENIARLEYEDTKSRVLFGMTALITLYLGLSSIVMSFVISNPSSVALWNRVLGGFLIFVIGSLIVAIKLYLNKYKNLEDIIKKENE